MNIGKKKSFHHGKLREALIKMGTKLLHQQGLAAFSLREVAKQAGVSHGAPYRHFEDKTVLLEAIAAQGFRNLEQVCDMAMDRFPDDPIQQLETAGRGYLDFALTYPGVLHLMFGGGLDLDDAGAELRLISTSSFGKLLQIVENGKEAGHYCSESTLNLTYACLAMCHGLSLLISSAPLKAVQHDPRKFEQLVQSVLTALFQGLIKR